MTLSRVQAFLVAVAACPLEPAAAQFAGMPGSQSGATPAPQCQQLLANRDEVQKHGQALQAAGKKKLPPDEVCKLFKALLGAEGKMVKGLEENSATCGVPADVIKQVKSGHERASQMGKQMCARVADPMLHELDELLIRGPWPRRYAPVRFCSEKILQAGVPCVE